jgi:predicted nucleic acid-binding protein
LLIDTDVVSYWITQNEQGNAFAALVAGHELAVSFATYGELLANTHRLRWGERRIQTLRNHLNTFVVVPYTVQVVELWAEMHAKLSGHLQKGGTNDLWTAACALSLNPQLPIVTNNLSDFGTIAKAFPKIHLIHPSR